MTQRKTRHKLTPRQRIGLAGRTHLPMDHFHSLVCRGRNTSQGQEPRPIGRFPTCFRKYMRMDAHITAIMLEVSKITSPRNPSQASRRGSVIGNRFTLYPEMGCPAVEFPEIRLTNPHPMQNINSPMTGTNKIAWILCTLSGYSYMTTGYT
jgi:hypothetical protein